MKKQPDQATKKGGRKEVLTLALAMRIAEMVKQMPDAGVAVTWDSIIAHTEKRFGHKFHRNRLSQKEWDGRKLISEAFDEAKDVQKRLHKEAAPKYAAHSRSFLQRRIVELEARILTLRQELETARAKQYDELCILLSRRTPLRRLVEQQAVTDSQ
jgi:hypothetical protein